MGLTDALGEKLPRSEYTGCAGGSVAAKATATSDAADADLAAD